MISTSDLEAFTIHDAMDALEEELARIEEMVGGAGGTAEMAVRLLRIYGRGCNRMAGLLGQRRVRWRERVTDWKYEMALRARMYGTTAWGWDSAEDDEAE